MLQLLFLKSVKVFWTNSWYYEYIIVSILIDLIKYNFICKQNIKMEKCMDTIVAEKMSKIIFLDAISWLLLIAYKLLLRTISLPQSQFI